MIRIFEPSPPNDLADVDDGVACSKMTAEETLAMFFGTPDAWPGTDPAAWPGTTDAWDDEDAVFRRAVEQATNAADASMKLGHLALVERLLAAALSPAKPGSGPPSLPARLLDGFFAEWTPAPEGLGRAVAALFRRKVQDSRAEGDPWTDD